MAILNGIIKKLNGSAGSLTFKTVNGQTIVSEKVTAVKNSRTAGQQRQRMKWVNIIHMYSGISPLLKYGFEKKSATQSDYNMFVKLNTQATPVYLTKGEADGGGCIAAPYQITQGSLPAIVTSTSSAQDGTGASTVTDIALGSLVISATTTVADFSNAVVLNNSDYDYGDQISFYDILQHVNADTTIPYCSFSASYVVLDKDSTVKLWDQTGSTGFTSHSDSDGDGSGDGDSDGYVLGHGDDEGDGCFAWVHSRYDGGKTKVSTQSLIDNNSMLVTYQSDDAYAGACKSYGGTNSAFLTPDTNEDATTVDGSSSSNGSSSSSTTTTKYTLSLSASPSNGGTVSGAGSYDAGTSVTATATAASGYTFSRWSDGVTTASRTVTLNANTTLVAQFTASGSSSSDTGGSSSSDGNDDLMG